MARKPPALKPASALMPGMGGMGAGKAPKPRKSKVGQGIGVPKVPTGGVSAPMGLAKGGLVGGKKKVAKTAKPPRTNDGKLSGKGWGWTPPWKKNQRGSAPAGSGAVVKGASPAPVRMASGGMVGKKSCY